METASFTGFIKTILYLVIGFYIVKFLVRLFFPIVVRKVVSKAEESFKQQYQQQQENIFTSQQNSSSREKIVSDASISNNPKSTKKVGEYVDYEEIE